MAPPSKRTRQLRQLREAKLQKRAVERASIELIDEPQFIVIDEDFDLDGMAHDQNVVEQRWQDLIKWNPEADGTMRAPYTGESRATKFRRQREKEQRHRSVADCPKISTFFKQINSTSLSACSV